MSLSVRLRTRALRPCCFVTNPSAARNIECFTNGKLRHTAFALLRDMARTGPSLFDSGAILLDAMRNLNCRFRLLKTIRRSAPAPERLTVALQKISLGSGKV